MSIDERLLQMNRPAPAEDNAGTRSGDLRQARRARGSGGKGERPASLRQGVLEARRQKAAKESAVQKLLGAAVSPFRKATSRLLRQSWYNLIDSYGATLIWINVHFFLSAALGDKFFCKPGHEWADVVSDKAGGGKTVEQLEMAQKAAGMAEKGLVGCVNAVIFFTLFFLCVVIYLIIDKTSGVLGALYKVVADIIL